MAEELKDRQEVVSGVLRDIEDIRARNNVNWMEILRIAIEHAPDETARVLREIRANDALVANRTTDLMEVLGR